MAAVKMGLWKDCYNGVYRKVKWMKYSVGSVLTKLQLRFWCTKGVAYSLSFLGRRGWILNLLNHYDWHIRTI